MKQSKWLVCRREGLRPASAQTLVSEIMHSVQCSSIVFSSDITRSHQERCCQRIGNVCVLVLPGDVQ